MTTEETSSSPARRRVIKAGIAAGAGIGAAAVVGSPAEAAAGQPVIIGSTNDAGGAGTVLTGGSATNPALTLEASDPDPASLLRSPPLVLRPTPSADIPQELPTGSLAVTPAGEFVIGGRTGERAYVNTTQWSNQTMALRPQRHIDTRLGLPQWVIAVDPDSTDTLDSIGRVKGGRTLTYSFTDPGREPPRSLPPFVYNAQSVYLNITVTNTVAGGFLTAYSPSIARPGVSSLNWWGPNQVLSNMVEVRLGKRGYFDFSFSVYVSSPACVIVDLCGLVCDPHWP